MIKDNDIYIIEQYIDDKLDEKSKKAFKKRLTEDESFKKLFEERKALSKLWVEAEEYNNVKNLVKEVMDNSTSKRNIFNNKFILIAASVIFLIGFYFLIHQNKGKNQNDTPKIAHKEVITKDTASFSLKKDLPVKYASVDSVKNGVKLLFPGDKAYIEKDDFITFRWSSKKEGTDTLIIKRVDNNDIIFSEKIKLKKGKLKANINFPTGKYYWYIKDQKDSLKFEVKK